MREFSAAELDLMAAAFERARDLKMEVLDDGNLSSKIVELLVDGITEAMAWGERDVERLVSAALSKANQIRRAGW